MLTEEERVAIEHYSDGTYWCDCEGQFCQGWDDADHRHNNLVDEVERIVTAHVSAALREAADAMEQTWTRTDDATYYDESVTSGHVEWLRDRADRADNPTDRT